ncbi:MAG: CopG family transcriptional regulator [Planctomycetota bacterium]
MAASLVSLSEQEMHSLCELSLQTGKSPDELLHNAIAQYLDQFKVTQRQAALQQARGMWKNRTDLPSVDEMRAEFDRNDHV